MLHKDQRIQDFARLGDFLLSWSDPHTSKDLPKPLMELIPEAQQALPKAFAHNGWFVEENVRQALLQWGSLLNEKMLKEWTSHEVDPVIPKKVGIIMAGNIPLVGFHDLLSVLITGHIAMVKMSREDEQLFPVIFKVLFELSPEWKNRIQIVSKLEGIEAVIATGSNNTARYFDHYFGKYPHIIRKNRHGVAVLSGDESDDELNGLGRDIFLYFGLGCRNVTKVYIPRKMDLDRIFGNILTYSDVVQNKKYGNNYDYHRAIFMLNRIPFLENGFCIFNENKDLGSPVSVVHYERYDDLEQVRSELESNADSIQCVVGRSEVVPGAVPFGESQKPGLEDYADGVDILAFLRKLNGPQ
ncbi:MAG: acyl-CoA reductase [Bacteroidota bacterium]|nr:acyl-CoA reductase [Bacteroidota bacterium]